jgi:hypothetical protein
MKRNRLTVTIELTPDKLAPVQAQLGAMAELQGAIADAVARIAHPVYGEESVTVGFTWEDEEVGFEIDSRLRR